MKKPITSSSAINYDLLCTHIVNLPGRVVVNNVDVGLVDSLASENQKFRKAEKLLHLTSNIKHLQTSPAFSDLTSNQF
jgi:hypothetical protein